MAPYPTSSCCIGKMPPPVRGGNSTAQAIWIDHAVSLVLINSRLACASSYWLQSSSDDSITELPFPLQQAVCGAATGSYPSAGSHASAASWKCVLQPCGSGNCFLHLSRIYRALHAQKPWFENVHVDVGQHVQKTGPPARLQRLHATHTSREPAMPSSI